jgi:hypothetical protein
MNSQKVVIPVKTGVQYIINYPKTLDSGFRRNDKKLRFMAFCEFSKIDGFANNHESQGHSPPARNVGRSRLLMFKAKMIYPPDTF